MKSYIHSKVYVYTIKQAFDLVKQSKKDAQLKEKVFEDYIEIKIKIPR